METGLIRKLKDNEKELTSLKFKDEKKIIHLKGALKGIKVSDEEIKEAKRSLFKISS